MFPANPHELPSRQPLRTSLATHLQLTLRPVFELLGASWKKPSLSIFAVAMVTLVIVVYDPFVALATGDF